MEEEEVITIELEEEVLIEEEMVSQEVTEGTEAEDSEEVTEVLQPINLQLITRSRLISQLPPLNESHINTLSCFY